MSEKNKKKVLVVDDDDNLRLALTDKLIIEGYDALEAKNGKEGLEIALKAHPDLILIDVLMPIMNGLEMLKALRSDEWGEKARVIILTVLESAESVAEAVSDGGFTYLIKTNLNTDDIVKKVGDTLNN